MKIPGQYAKFLTAIAGQAVVYLQWKYGATGAQWLQAFKKIIEAPGMLAL